MPVVRGSNARCMIWVEQTPSESSMQEAKLASDIFGNQLDHRHCCRQAGNIVATKLALSLLPPS